METKKYTQLSVMMFLQFFIWGAWFVTLGSYLGKIGFSGSEIGEAYSMNNIAAIIAPFFIGLVADRYFAAEKVMAFLHIAGAAVLYYVSDMNGDNASIIWGLLIYNACYMPTLALVNTISFTQMTTPDTEFPKVRVWGTLGWIVAGLSITFILSGQIADVETTSVPMKLAAAASLLLGLYSLKLPHTPPKADNEKVTIGDILGAKAFSLLKDKSFFIFVLSSMLISIPLAFYYGFTNLYLNEVGMDGVAGTMSLGQVSEVAFMVAMPFFFRRLGVKWMLFVGMMAWVLRYALFATGNLDGMAWMLYLGIILHGICYDFFFVTGQIYVDKKASEDIRSSAQAFIALMTYGVGMFIGSILAGRVVDHFTVDGVKNWEAIWWTPCIFAAVIAVLFFLVFKDTSAEEKTA